MKCPHLSDLPAPPAGRSGWPWSHEPEYLTADEENIRRWPRISVVTPSYNQAQYVEETIRAVLLQGYPDLEYIIVEDGSTDETHSVLEKYRPWITVLRNERNIGMSETINRGWALCTGDIITWIATDDVYCPGAFHRIANMFEENPDCGAFVGAFQCIDHVSQPFGEIQQTCWPFSGPEDLSLETMPWRLHQVATFYSRAALDVLGRFVRAELHHNMDRELIFRVAKSYRICTTTALIAWFRVHDKSKSWSVNNIVAMARDHAHVYDYFMTANAKDNKRRHWNKRKKIANGYVRAAKYGQMRWRNVRLLLHAFAVHPLVVLRRDWYVGVVRTLQRRRS